MVHLWYLVFSKHILSSKFLQQDSTMFLFNRYTVFSMFFQFLVPVVIISTIYIRILLYLKVRRLFWLQYNSQNHKLQILIELLIHKQQITNCGQITKGWQTSGCRAIECLCQAWFRNSEKQTWSFSPSQSLSSSHGFLSGISCFKKTKNKNAESRAQKDTNAVLLEF